MTMRSFLRVSALTLQDLPVLALVSQRAWSAATGDWELRGELAAQCVAEVIVGSWSSEFEHRRATVEAPRERGFTQALSVDGDEVIEPSLLEAMLKVAEAGLAERVYVEMDTYSKSPEYVICPRERLTPLVSPNGYSKKAGVTGVPAKRAPVKPTGDQ